MITQAEKVAWVAALRSGVYEQAKGTLRNEAGTKFCCLGVYCEVKGFKRFRSESYVDGEGQVFGGYLRESLGEFDANADPALARREFQYVVVDMNDEGKTFAEIADFIEANLRTSDEPVQGETR